VYKRQGRTGVLEAEEEELMLLAEKVTDSIRGRVIERPDAFRQLAKLDDESLDKVLRQIGSRCPRPGLANLATPG
jgi:hypothetical protein